MRCLQLVAHVSLQRAFAQSTPPFQFIHVVRGEFLPFSVSLSFFVSVCSVLGLCFYAFPSLCVLPTDPRTVRWCLLLVVSCAGCQLVHSVSKVLLRLSVCILRFSSFLRPCFLLACL